MSFPCFSLLWNMVTIDFPSAIGVSFILAFLLRSATSPPDPGSIGWELLHRYQWGGVPHEGQSWGSRHPELLLAFFKWGDRCLGRLRPQVRLKGTAFLVFILVLLTSGAPEKSKWKVLIGCHLFLVLFIMPSILIPATNVT